MPSETALVLADLIEDTKAFPDEAVHDLHLLLGDNLVRVHPGAYRWDLLHVLVTLIREANGDHPTVSEYDSARRVRFPDAPAASTLTVRFGSWLKALNAASRLPHLSQKSPVWTQTPAARTTYTPAEIAAAIAQFRSRWGVWPRPSEYRLWSRATRRSRRGCGAPDPRLPDINIILKRFGSFDRAVDYSKSIYGDA